MLKQFVIKNSIDKSTKLPVSYAQWAEKNLSSEERSRFNDAIIRQQNILTASGGSFEPLWQTVNSKILGREIQILIGTKLIGQSELPPDDPEFLEFEARFAKDSNIMYQESIQL
jgi:hypothetical protein